MENLTFEKLPSAVANIIDRLQNIEMLVRAQSQEAPKPKYVDIKGAVEITSKSANALRVQVSLGNIKAFKRGSRLYFDREYLERWLIGNLED